MKQIKTKYKKGEFVGYIEPHYPGDPWVKLYGPIEFDGVASSMSTDWPPNNIGVLELLKFDCIHSKEEEGAVWNYLIIKHDMKHLDIKETPLKYDGDKFTDK